MGSALGELILGQETRSDKWEGVAAHTCKTQHLGDRDRTGLSSRPAQLHSKALSQQNKNIKINNDNKQARSSSVLYSTLIWGWGR